MGAEEYRRAYGAPNLKSWIVGNLMTEVVSLEPDLPSLSMFILLKKSSVHKPYLVLHVGCGNLNIFDLITYAVKCIKMSTEVLSLAVVKELISTQERTFRQTVEMFATNMKEDINSIRKTVDDLKCSLNFSQRDIDDINLSCTKLKRKSSMQRKPYLVRNGV